MSTANTVRDDCPLVSVIMNCYNSETYLREAIDSVYAQTYENWELIFWDNASADSSPEIAKSYDSRLKYFRGTETIPLGAARNQALALANGELIAFLDCDDLWLPDKLAKQALAMANSNYSLCYGGIITINEQGAEIGTRIPKHSNGNLFHELLMQFDIEIPTAMFRKSALSESNLSFDKNVMASEEYCLFMQLAVDHPYCVLSEPLAKYRVRENSLTNQAISKWAVEREYTLDLIRKNHPGIEKIYRDGFAEAYARARYYRARYLVSQGDKLDALKELWKNIFINYRYAALFAILLLPTPVWNLVHKTRLGR